MTSNQPKCFMVLAQRLNFAQAVDDLFMAQDGYRGSLKSGILRDSFQPTVVDIFCTMRGIYPDIHVFLEPRSHSGLHRHFWATIVNFGSETPGEVPLSSHTLVWRSDNTNPSLPFFPDMARKNFFLQK